MSLPREFREQFDSKGESFFQIAETLYENHGDQYTLSELADEVGLSNSRVSDHLSNQTDEDWVNKHSGDTSYVWNTEKYNPVEIETTDAVFGLYTDLYGVLKKHLRSSTSGPAIFGLLFFITAFMNWLFYFGLSVGLIQESALPAGIYLGLGIAFLLAGVAVTLLSPLIALANRVRLRMSQWWQN